MYLITIYLHSDSWHLFLASAFELGLSPHQPGLWYRRTRRGVRAPEIGPTSVRNRCLPHSISMGILLTVLHSRLLARALAKRTLSE